MENKLPKRPRPVIINGPRPKAVGPRVAPPKPANAAAKPAPAPAPKAAAPEIKPVTSEAPPVAAAPIVSEPIQTTFVSEPEVKSWSTDHATISLETPSEDSVSSNGYSSNGYSSNGYSSTIQETDTSTSYSSTTDNSVSSNGYSASVEEPVAPITKTPSSKPLSKREEAEKKKKEELEKKKAAAKSKPERKPKAESTGDSGKGVLIALVLLLTASTGYLSYDKFFNHAAIVEESQKNEATLKSDIDIKVAEISRLQDSLRAVISEKERLGLELAGEQAKLAELEDLKSQVKNHRVSISSLNKKLSKFKDQYETVQANVGSLLAENQKLVAEKVELERAIQAKDDSLKAIAEVQVSLAEKVAHASYLSAANIDIKVINTAGKEMNQADSYKAMSVSKIKCSMKLADNSVAEHGKKDIYMVLTEPSGTVLFEGDKSFMVDGRKTVYTDKQTINFNNTKQTVSFLYFKGGRYKPGKYKVEFYADGKRIGDTQLVLNK